MKCTHTYTDIRVAQTSLFFPISGFKGNPHSHIWPSKHAHLGTLISIYGNRPFVLRHTHTKVHVRSQDVNWYTACVISWYTAVSPLHQTPQALKKKSSIRDFPPKPVCPFCLVISAMNTSNSNFSLFFAPCPFRVVYNCVCVLELLG